MATGFDDVPLDVLRTRRSEKWRAFPPPVLPAFVAEMDFSLAPVVKEALRAAIERDDCGYASPDGVGEAFASFAASRDGWQVDPARVHLVADVMSGVDEVLRLVTGLGDGVVINPPVYPPFFDHIRDAGRRVVEVPMRNDEFGWQLDLAGLQAAFRDGARCLLLCSPHNPTGRVFSRAELDEVAWLADRYDVFVVADEIHAPLTLPGSRHTPYLSLGEHAGARAVVVTSASKAFNLAGLKAAVVVAGSAEVEAILRRMPPAATFRAGLFGVIAGVAAWRDGAAWLDELLGRLDANRALFGKLLAERLPAVRYIAPEASYLAWLDCGALGLGDDPRARFLDRGAVALGRGLDFGAAGAGYARVTIGTTPEILDEIVRRMASAL